MDVQTLINIDRDMLLSMNGSDSVFFDRLMYFLTSGITWIPLYLSLLFLIIKNNENMKQILLIVSCVFICIILSDGMADFVSKPYFERFRPSTDPILKYTVRIVNGMRGGDYGFFSAHASNTFSIALFFCMLVRSRLLSVALIIWSLVNCYTRIYLGLHYPGDIIFGLLWGGIVGLVSYFIYFQIAKRTQEKANFISSQYTSTGYDYNDIDICISVLALTLVYGIIQSVAVYI